MAGDSGITSSGRSLLARATDAIEGGEWQDLANLLEDHSVELRSVRSRLGIPEQRERRAAPVDNEEERGKTGGHSNGYANGHAKHSSDGVTQANCGAPGKRGFGIRLSIAAWADAHPWAATLVVQTLVLASYAPALWYHGFVMDDSVAIERNPNVVGETFSLAELLRRDYWGLPMHGSGWTNKSFRPLTTLTFRWNYLLHGLMSCGFHIANVLLHCLASAIVGRSAAIVTGLPGGAAAICAALFGVHPVHTENVLYLVGRADVLAALLGLIALNLYSSRFCPASEGAVQDRTRRLPFWRDLLVIVPFAALIVASGLCKETGFMLFAVPFGMEALDFLQSRGAAASPRSRRRVAYRTLALVLGTLVVFLARYRHTGGTKLNMSPQDNPISFEAEKQARVLSYAFLHGVYAKLLVWPWFLCYDYSMDAIPIVRELGDCRLLLTVAAYVGLSGAITAALAAPPRKRRAALVSLALMVVPFLPASNVLFPVGTVIGERLLYLPSIGLCLGFCVWAFPLSSTQSVGSGAANGHGGGGKIKAARGGKAQESRADLRRGAALHSIASGSPRTSLFIVGLVGVFGVRTYYRVQDWSSSETLFLKDGATQPRSSKTQFNLGITHMQNQEWDLAVEAFIRCAYADPLSSLPFYRIGQIEILRGRFDSAEKYLAAALDKFGASLMVRDEEVFHDLAIALFQNGKPDAAERRLQVALQLNPDFAKGWANLACCIASRDIHGAARAAQKAATIAPENPQYWANLALLSRHAGDLATASESWNNARMLYPAMPEPFDCTWEFAPSG
eukprot:TRINITY_DN4728_c0_g1_i1.p1 TRINITY_DN4728_c0_g1~~TRINITY_DN4728_c0_g1_i1.p1  ORF type:complete len:792 (+),score=141.78 TRINITY_DN4728_c0_g1_i1:198-2573(+)